MDYTSTRNSEVKVTASKAITDGLSPDGGLYIPTEIPELSRKDILSLSDKSYMQRAKKILGLYLSDFTEEEINYCVNGAYKKSNFNSPQIAPLVNINGGTYILELFRGPTCAFKDMALQLLPYLLTVSAKKNLYNKEIVILVATSGDTGKAALEGFKNVEGTKILVFYPSEGVSNMQKLQMATQEGGNVGVAAIRGNFDDAQNGVKAIFTDRDILDKFGKHNFVFSSANSINWGRLAPQIVYYVSAYCELIKTGQIRLGEKINIVVPTGNFGNILAAYYAKEMGIPVNKLICASNKNKVLTDFINTGVYNRNREFYTTSSPSMDILISSNLERLLYLLSGENDSAVNEWFGLLRERGEYSVGKEVKEKLSESFYAGSCDEDETKAAIAECFKEYGYLCDTHTAVGVGVYERYKKQTGDKTVTVIASTASPYKFPAAVLSAVTGKETDTKDEFLLLDELHHISGVPVPAQLVNLKGKPVRFDKVYDKNNMTDAVFSMLGI